MDHYIYEENGTRYSKEYFILAICGFLGFIFAVFTVTYIVNEVSPSFLSYIFDFNKSDNLGTCKKRSHHLFITI